MSTPSEERYLDLKKLAEEIAPELFDELSWILLLNLDLIPEEDVNANPNIRFSYSLMNNDLERAISIAQKFASSSKPISQHYQKLLNLDPKLEKTSEIANSFFSLARRRIEIAKELGIHHY